VAKQVSPPASSQKFQYQKFFSFLDNASEDPCPRKSLKTNKRPEGEALEALSIKRYPEEPWLIKVKPRAVPHDLRSHGMLQGSRAGQAKGSSAVFFGPQRKALPSHL
jgi:hypothetical protein